MSITIEELKQKYAVLPIADLGDCVMVPGDEFNPDWAVYLGDQGYPCINDVLDGHPVTFVQLTKVSGNKEVKETEKTETKKKGYALRGPNWVEADDKTLLETYDGLVAQGEKYGSHKVLAKMFKGRSESAISQRLKRLLKKREKQLQKNGEDSKSTKVEELGEISVSADYETILKMYADLKTELKGLKALVVDDLATVEAKLRKHKHAVGSGEAMLPMEASR